MRKRKRKNMSTRSRIGVMMDDDTVKQVYCHWDGYVEGVGFTLVENYDSIELAKELINLGDISSLGYNISTDEPHTFENRVKGVTVFYGRDRGEAGTQPAFVTMDEWLSVAFSSSIDFYYLYNEGQWWIYDLLEKNGWQNVKSFFPQYTLTEEELACSI
jgi:hypothetical protein